MQPVDTKRESSVVIKTLIRGTFPLPDLQHLVYLVKSLCPEVGHLGEFRDWDRVYSAAPDVKAPKNSIRLRNHLVVPGVAQQQQQQREQSPTFSLMYLGIMDRRVPIPCEKRPITTVTLGQEAPGLLTLLGCVFVDEYVRRGVRYRTRAGYTIEVYVVERLLKPGVPKQCVPLVQSDQHAIVEISSEDGATPEELTAFMQHLQPIVQLRSATKKR